MIRRHPTKHTLIYIPNGADLKIILYKSGSQYNYYISRYIQENFQLYDVSTVRWGDADVGIVWYKTSAVKLLKDVSTPKVVLYLKKE